MDRKKTESAGRIGFQMVAGYERLEQRRWQPAMIGYGHFGNHASIVLHGWNKEFVAPLLCGE